MTNMSKKNIFAGLLLVILVFVVYRYFYTDDSSFVPYAPEEECFDCGAGGWKLTDIKCDTDISGGRQALMCLSGFEWSDINLDTDLDEVKEGYIRINGKGFTKSGEGTIKVYNFHRWSVDERGNIYVEGQGG